MRTSSDKPREILDQKCFLIHFQKLKSFSCLVDVLNVKLDPKFLIKITFVELLNFLKQPLCFIFIKQKHYLLFLHVSFLQLIKTKLYRKCIFSILYQFEEIILENFHILLSLYQNQQRLKHIDFTHHVQKQYLILCKSLILRL